MRLHVFNPEHDLALAFGGERFTAPRAGREMRRCLGFLPAFWAGPDDFVMVDDMEIAMKASAPWSRYLPHVRFVPFRAEKSRVMVRMDTIDSVDAASEGTAITIATESSSNGRQNGMPGEPPSGEKPSGEKPSGDFPGDPPSGEKPSGDFPGDPPSGEKPSGDFPGDPPSGEKPTGDPPDGAPGSGGKEPPSKPTEN